MKREIDIKQWKIFQFSMNGKSYSVKSESKDEAINFLKVEHDIDIKNCFEIPGSEWDKPTIEMYVDNDKEKKPFYITLREAFNENTTELLCTNDADILE